MVVQMSKTQEEPTHTWAHTVSTFDRNITEAFQADVENFLLNFEKRSSHKFCDFADVWKEMKFSYINSEQQYYSFIRQHAENCFFILKKFIVYPKNDISEIGALYLLYSLYFKQIVKDWVKIRITDYEYSKLGDLVVRLREQRNLEAVFCYGKLVAANAFEYVCKKKPLAPEARHLRNLSEYYNDTFQLRGSSNAKIKLEEKLNQDNFFCNLSSVTNDYDRALKKFSLKNPGLGMFESTIVESIHKTLNSLDPASDEAHCSESEDSVYSRRKAIKKRAMENKGTPRHREPKRKIVHL